MSKVVMTDDKGVVIASDATEPLPGSVVMTEGCFGTAWQRYFSDGLWHRVGSKASRTWAQMLNQRNLVLVYDAPERGV